MRHGGSMKPLVACSMASYVALLPFWTFSSVQQSIVLGRIQASLFKKIHPNSLCLFWGVLGVIMQTYALKPSPSRISMATGSSQGVSLVDLWWLILFGSKSRQGWTKTLIFDQFFMLRPHPCSIQTPKTPKPPNCPQTVTADKVHLWAERAWKDHCRKAPRDASSKQKAGGFLNFKLLGHISLVS